MSYDRRFPPTPGIKQAVARVTRGMGKHDDLPAPRVPRGDGPYRPELAEAFREGARDLQIDRLDVPADALVEEAEGGVYVHCRVYVADGERMPIAGDETFAHQPDSCPSSHHNRGDDICADCGHDLNPGEPDAKLTLYTVSGRPIFDVQVAARNRTEAADRWRDALNALSQPAVPAIPGLDMAFFSDEDADGHPVPVEVDIAQIDD